MAILFQESNMPSWTSNLVQLRVDDVVDLNGVKGTIVELYDSRSGEVMAKIKTPDNGKEVNVTSLEKI
jgi:hypothetical protein